MTSDRGTPQPEPAPPEFDAERLPPGIFFEDHPLPALIFERGSLVILRANRAACALYGYTPAEFPQLSLDDIRPPEDVPTFRAALRERDQRPLPTYWRHRTRDGRIL